MKYEIIYYDSDGAAIIEESPNFAIFQIDDEKKNMRCFYQSLNGMERNIPDDEWFNYVSIAPEKEHEILEEDVFIICL